MTLPTVAAPGVPAAQGAAAPVIPDANALPIEGAPAPVEPAAPAPAPSIPKLEDPKPEAPPLVVYDPTGDAALDVALKFVGGLGIAEDHPAMVAAAEGDFTILEAFLKADPKAEGWESFIELGKQSLQRRQDAQAQVATQVTEAVHAAAGGAEKWAEIKVWAAAEADASQKEAINAMLEAGPFQAGIITHWLAAQYAEASGTIIEPASASSQNSSRPAASAGSPLTETQYVAELNALRHAIGSGFESSPQVAALNARYLASKSR